MSSIYINEPPTTGKVNMKTSVGEICIELWCKESPLACRNFIQLAMEKYYDNTIFHRVVKDFCVQGGDPTGTGLGGESIYEEPFKDEFHSRLKFATRGRVAMANAGKDDNRSQFFFTLAATPELNNKHTIFGKVTGPTIFNMLRLAEGEVDANERPVEPKRIISIEILKNPFEDIVPRQLDQPSNRPVEQVKSQSQATKNFKLLSFGEEAEEDEDELSAVQFNKGKSLPDLVEDRSSARKETEFKKTKRKMPVDESESDLADQPLSGSSAGRANPKPAANKYQANDESESEDEYAEQKKKMEAAQMEIDRMKREELKKRAIEKIDKQEQRKHEDNPVLSEFKKSKEKYSKCNYSKSANREQQALLLLEKFKKKLKGDEPVDSEQSSWLKHKLQVEEEDEENPVLAKDANLKTDDWYDVYDPRSALSKQRREMDAGIHKKAKKR